jgi:cellulose synthase/poly-beta-1,6-N-acetylglucosamine synthase-like glycosyltransferase
MKSISVVIPTYNEEKNIEKCLQSLCNQTILRDKYEIIIVDGQSKDSTREIAARYADKVILQKSPGVGGARNDGVRITKSPIIATTDADTVLPPDWLERILAAFANKDLVCLFGALRPSRKSALYRFAFKIGNAYFLVGSRTGIFHNVCGANMAFRRSAFLAAGGFSSIPVCDDVELSLRIKKHGKIWFDPTLAVEYSTRRLEKFGILKMVYIWSNGIRKLLLNKVEGNENYSKCEY